MCGLNYAIHMRALLKLSYLVRTLIIDSIKVFLRNLESPLMIALLALSLLLVAYIHMVLLLILIMNVQNNCYMLLMILLGHEDHCLRGVR
jgi:hypothetical protein